MPSSVSTYHCQPSLETHKTDCIHGPRRTPRRETRNTSQRTRRIGTAWLRKGGRRMGAKCCSMGYVSPLYCLRLLTSLLTQTAGKRSSVQKQPKQRTAPLRARVLEQPLPDPHDIPQRRWMSINNTKLWGAQARQVLTGTVRVARRVKNMVNTLLRNGFA